MSITAKASSVNASKDYGVSPRSSRERSLSDHDEKKAAQELSTNGSIVATPEDDTEYAKGHPVIRNGADLSRYIISTRDDGDPALTFRCLVLGTLFTLFASVITMLYVFKPVLIGISPVFLQLLVFIFGEAWYRFTPHPDRFKWKWLQRLLRSMNFGQPFGLKEHVVSSLIASSANNGLSGVEVFAVERLFYNTAVSATTAILGIFSISLCGFVLAGLLRPFIVFPSEAVYWTNLPQIVLFQNLHFDRKANRDRLKSFAWAISLSAAWELFPAYIMPWFAGFSVFCLASINAPTNTRRVFGKIFGGVSSNEGMGFLSLGFDWQYITSSFLSLPLKNQINYWIGIVIWYPSMLALYYGNAWKAKDFPFMSSSLYAPNGTQFVTTSILNSEGIIDPAKVEEVGLPYLTATTVWGYLTQNLAIGALVAHVLIFWRKDIWLAWKQFRSRTQPDPHYQAMLKYKEVPFWWYLALFVLCFLAGLIVNIKGDTTLGVGPYIIALLLGFAVGPFSCLLYALYGNSIMTNQLSKMVAGAVQPGRPLSNLYFASWSHQVILLAINLAAWLKIGQYTKIPPRVMFGTQIYGTLLGAFVNYAVMITVVSNQRETLLSPLGNNVWSGSYLQSLNSQAITWSLAKQMYSLGGRYPYVPIALAFGFCLPIAHWLIIKAFPRFGRWPIHTAVIASNMCVAYYGSTSWILSQILTGVFSQIYLRRRQPRIYNKYNYLIGAALDGGSQIVIFILSFAVYGASGQERPFPTWFGNPDGNPDHCL